MPSSIYRPNVAAIIMSDAGHILVGERIDSPDSWQFPQGGLDPGESAEAGLTRELHEELSLEPGDYTVEERRGPYRYLFPPGLTKKGFGGQEQMYFRLRLRAPERKINVATADPEFRAVRWIEPSDYASSWVQIWKRDVYRQVFQDFFALKIV